MFIRHIGGAIGVDCCTQNTGTTNYRLHAGTHQCRHARHTLQVRRRVSSAPNHGAISPCNHSWPTQSGPEVVIHKQRPGLLLRVYMSCCCCCRCRDSCSVGCLSTDETPLRSVLLYRVGRRRRIALCKVFRPASALPGPACAVLVFPGVPADDQGRVGRGGVYAASWEICIFWAEARGPKHTEDPAARLRCRYARAGVAFSKPFTTYTTAVGPGSRVTENPGLVQPAQDFKS